MPELEYLMWSWSSVENYTISNEIVHNIYTLTDVNMVSDWVIKTTLDQPNCSITRDIPLATSTSLDTVLKNLGNTLVLERYGEELDWEI